MWVLSRRKRLHEGDHIMAAATAAAIVSVVAAGAGVQQQRQATKQQEKASKQQRRLEEFKAARAKRKEVRQQRVLQAQLEQQAVTTGTTGSSGVAGGIAGVQQQTASNIANIGVQQSFGRSISGRLQKAADFRSNAATFQAVSGVASSFAGSKGFEDLGSEIFGE